MRRLILIVHAIVLFASGCSSVNQVPTGALVPVVLNGDSRQTNALQINSAAVNNGVLTAAVSYSGGCRNHDFVLFAGHAFQVTISDSVQLKIALIHNANDDPCEASLSELFHFDLRPIKRRYQQTYNRDTGTVYLRLDGYPGSLVYRF